MITLKHLDICYLEGVEVEVVEAEEGDGVGDGEAEEEAGDEVSALLEVAWGRKGAKRDGDVGRWAVVVLMGR